MFSENLLHVTALRNECIRAVAPWEPSFIQKAVACGSDTW